jgi:hypothetical protein
MKLVYIAGPYRADCAMKTQRNIFRAETLGKHVALNIKGWYPIIPHMNTAMWDFARELDSIEDSYYLESTLEVMRRCDAVLVLCRSKGVDAEIAEAERLNIPVYYNPEDVPHG